MHSGTSEFKLERKVDSLASSLVTKFYPILTYTGLHLTRFLELEKNALYAKFALVGLYGDCIAVVGIKLGKPHK